MRGVNRFERLAAPSLAAVAFAIGGTACGAEKEIAFGTVECASGREVEGVWVQAEDGPGWASWSSNPRQRHIASFSRILPHAETYGVHVGCGGSPQNWESSNFSPGVRSSERPDFICYDSVAVSTASHRLGTCAMVNS